MLLKSPDDKSKRLGLLEDLQRSDLIDARQRKWLREELSRVKTGIAGEKESAYVLDQYFKGGKNHVWLHDLRIVFEGDVAQIDHLVINRAFGMYLIETKNYGGNVSINEQGEFTIDYGDESFGVPSPIEQSRRHARILLRLMERLGIGNRTGGPLQCHHVVMFHPRAIIRRPPKSLVDTRNIIKADQFPSWHEEFTKEDGISTLEALRGLVNIRALETLKEWGEMLIRQHRPANPLELPDFMAARHSPEPAAGVSPRSPVPSPSPAPAAPAPAPGQKKLICLHCNAKITFNEGRFCWNQESRFKGGQYCREHQKLFPA